MDSSDFVPTGNSLEILRYLETLMTHRGGSVLLDEEGSLPLPVIFVQVEAGKPLVVDLSSAREVIARIRHGQAFRLVAQTGSKLLRSDLLTASSIRESDGAVLCEMPMPELLYVLQRRDSFRATLRKDLHCQVVLADGSNERELQGRLQDLSMGGCSVNLPLSAAKRITTPGVAYNLSLAFPNGRRLTLPAILRRVNPQLEQESLVTGFSFVEPTAEQSRELWFFVREIEREWGRSAERGDANLAPSPLFVEAEGKPQGDPVARAYLTPMTARLAACADFLSLQIQSLRTGGGIDSLQLSRQAERLLRLLDQDREALLFATACLSDDPLLVRHGLGVAVRLVDLLGKSVTPMERKSIAACAMVHELGRALLPSELMWDDDLDAGAMLESHRHVDMLLERLEECSWLNQAVLSSVVAQANERLDGSGYPRRLRDTGLNELARLMAVVDEIDFMSRRRGGIGARSISRSYEHLLRRQGKYDALCVKRYVEHFGRLPVGTLLRFEGGQLAWVLSLDAALRPAKVQLATEPGPPHLERLGKVLSGRDLAQLGRVAEVLASE